MQAWAYEIQVVGRLSDSDLAESTPRSEKASQPPLSL